MGTATIMDKVMGLGFAAGHIYSQWWFTGLWALMGLGAVGYIFRQKLQRRPAVFALHMAWVVILLGALATHMLGEQGMLHLREGQSDDFFISEGGERHVLPFEVRLVRFEMVCYPTTQTPMDYVSHLEMTDIVDGESVTTTNRVAMNDIGTHCGYRFYQSGYDEDGHGTTLSVSYDPVGIGLTYVGYALLFASLILLLVLPGEGFRQSLRRLRASQMSMAKTLAIVVGLLTLQGMENKLGAKAETTAPSVTEQTTPATPEPNAHSQEMVIPKETAHAYGSLMTYYNGRVCPLQTVARDFCIKLCGKDTYEGHTAEQVLMGWTLDAPHWVDEPMIKIGKKTANVLQMNGVGTMVTYRQLTSSGLERQIWHLRRVAANGSADASLLRDLEEAEEKVNIVRMLFAGHMLKLFPLLTDEGDVMWYSPADALPHGTGEATKGFVLNIFSQTITSLRQGNSTQAAEVARSIADFQQISLQGCVRAAETKSKTNGELTEDYLTNRSKLFPSHMRFRAEMIYNGLIAWRPLSMGMTAVGIVSFIITILVWKRKKTNEENSNKSKEYAQKTEAKTKRKGLTFKNKVKVLLAGLLILDWGYMVLMFGLRWFVSGHLPLGNGFETMQFMALCVSTLALVLMKRFTLALPFGYLLSGLCLMVSTFGEANPQITNLVPVLQSPLLSIHVCLVMVSYSLFGLCTLCGIAALAAMGRRGSAALADAACNQQVEGLTLMSRTMLYVAEATLAAGIFVGAIWANQSWGRYWGWDPKEVWALISMMVYALPLHPTLAPALTKPLAYNVFMTAAFLCVLVTYYGVNFLLGGLHGYA